METKVIERWTQAYLNAMDKHKDTTLEEAIVLNEEMKAIRGERTYCAENGIEDVMGFVYEKWHILNIVLTGNKVNEDFDFADLVAVEDGPGSIELLSARHLIKLVTNERSYLWASTYLWHYMDYVLEDGPVKVNAKKLYDEYSSELWENM